MFRPCIAALPLSAVLAAALFSPNASALIGSAQLIDGPSGAIRELGGVAMSADGTGGIVYRKDDDGRPHIYAAQFLNGTWGKPQRVDTGKDQRFESSWPAIAAGDGGRLVVVWMQEFGASDRLFSATLQPGSRRFEAPVPVDLNAGDSSLGTWPSVAMAPGGQAFVVYRVVTDAQPATTPPGTVLGEYRLARSTGQLWSGFGAPINRNPSAPQSRPTALNRPQIGLNQFGDGVVAFEELDDELVPRVYAKRVFASSVGIPLQVSPNDLDSGPVRAAADRFDLAVGRFGEAAVAWRQQAPQGVAGAFTRPRAFLAISPDVFSPDALKFGAPIAVDGGGTDGPDGALGPPTVSVAGPAASVAFGVGTAALAADTSETTAEAPVRVDTGAGETPGEPVVALGASGAAAFAWKQNAGNRGAVGLRERRADGVTSTRLASAPRGGQIDELAMAGSGLGDALVAFTQGTGAGRQIVAAPLDAPPDVFIAQAPNAWITTKTAAISWDPAAHAIGKVRYDVVVDDDTIESRLTGTEFALPTADLDDGRRVVTIVATDDADQETTSLPVDLKVDRNPPVARVRGTGRSVRVTVRDAKGASGAVASATRITFGDGSNQRTGTAIRHRYQRPGRYRITIRTRDQAGNTTVIRRTVSVR